MSLPRGISVIIPVFQAHDEIKRCLDSLILQTLNPDYFEILLIFNGDYHADFEYYQSIAGDYSTLNIQTFTTPIAGQGYARNIGLQQVLFSHTTFIDVDDTISTNYLESFYHHLSSDTVVINLMYDVEGKDVRKHPVTDQLLNWDKRSESINQIYEPLTMNVLKAIPSHLLRHYHFTHIMIGEDAVFFSDFFSRERVNIIINQDAYYYRYTMNDSITNQRMHYDFNILQRLKCIYELNKLLIDSQPRFNQLLIKKEINAQNRLMAEYLEMYPVDYNALMTDYKKYHFKYSNRAKISRYLVDRDFLNFVNHPVQHITLHDTLPDIIAGLIKKCYAPGLILKAELSQHLLDADAYNRRVLKKLSDYYHIDLETHPYEMNPWVILIIQAADELVLTDVSIEQFPRALQPVLSAKLTT